MPQLIAALANQAPMLTRSLARFALETPLAAMPPSGQSAAVRANLNWLACALAGSQTPTFQSALPAAQALAGPGPHGLVGRRETMDASQAVFINCLSSAAHAFDDTHLKTITHPTGPVAAVVWALARRIRSRLPPRAHCACCDRRLHHPYLHCVECQQHCLDEEGAV